MAVVEDLSVFLADFGQACLLSGASVTAVVDQQLQADVETGVVTQQIVARLPSSAASGAAAGATFEAAGTSYVVRQVLREPPDGAFTLLTLARA